MFQFDKMLQRIRLLDRSMRFDELKKVLEHYGYTISGSTGGSSHKTFRKAGCYPVTIPQHEPIKKAYVELVRDIIESEERNE